MKGNYNQVATFYDSLSRFIFGNAIVNAQKFLVSWITPNSTVLIVGGGTGWILEEIAKTQPTGLQIRYVELSEKMIALSKKRAVGNNEVTFICRPIQDVIFHETFDVVITPFLLDNFSASTTSAVFNKLHQSLIAGGLWLFVDFHISHNQRLWQKVMLKIMYFFFKVMCNIEADSLPDTAALFKTYQYRLLSSKSFFKNFICSLIYQKQKQVGGWKNKQ